MRGKKFVMSALFSQKKLPLARYNLCIADAKRFASELIENCRWVA
jgi:hypothetical protein